MNIVEETDALLGQCGAPQLTVYKHVLRVSRSTWLYWRKGGPNNKATSIALARINVILRKLILSEILPIKRGTPKHKSDIAKQIILDYISRL